MHGQALMAGLLAESASSWKNTAVYPVDAKFADSISDLQSFSAGKLIRLLRYLVVVTWTCLRRRIDTVILTPGFYRNTFLKDSLFIWLCSFVLRRRVIAWFHMDYGAFQDQPTDGWFAVWFRRTLLRCSHFVVCTESLRKTVPSFLPSTSVSALQNGIPDLAEGMPATPGSRERLRVLYVSNMNEEKGWRVLLEAAVQICASRQDVEFVFHGAPAGDYTEASIRALFAKNSPDGRIRYAGFLDAGSKAGVFRSADIFCMPSFTEAFPIAVLEAMAFGLPIVASRVGGIPDMLGPELAAGLVPPQDGWGLRIALEQLLDNRSALALFSIAGRRRFIEQFTNQSFSVRWQGFLEQAV